MRTGRAIILVLMLWTVPASAQENMVATIDPARPHVGQTVTVAYHAGSPAATLKDATQMIAEIMIVGDEDPRVLEPVLKKSGSTWRGSFQVPERGAQLILYRFRSGENMDDNGADVWRSLIYGTDGKPVRGAYLARATAEQYPTSLGFKLQKDSEAAAADIDFQLQ